MDTEVTFGAWLKQRRRTLDLTQKELARQVGCAVVTVRKFETDERRPSKDLAERLADCLSIPPEEYAQFIAFARSEPYLDQVSPPDVPAEPSPWSPTPAPPTSQLPQKLGRYEILAEIGRGGFATVYRARDTKLDRPVALKELKANLLADTDWIERFRREARVIARLDHPHIVTIYDVAQAEGRMFIVMRLVDGPGLDGLLAQRSRLPWPEAVEVVNRVAGGLDYAHAQSILHRDLKPANILIDPQRGSLLSDFGLAKLVGENSLSQSGDVVGTPHYIAPEIWDGQPAVPQTDIYALGCILYEILVGKRLFAGKTPPAIMAAHFRPPAMPKTWPEGVSPGVAKVLTVALAKQPNERYTTAGELAEALTLLAEDKPVSSYQVSQEPMRDQDFSPTPRPPHPPAPAPGLTTQSTPLFGRAREQQIRFCTSPGGVRIAYATVGKGPPLVKVANWLSHLEYDWRSPVWRHWLEGLSNHHTLVRYDERGCGLSDWKVEEFSVEAWVRDLETVVEAVGLDRFPLLGISQGGPIAIAYAVRHPEKVSHLILYGTFARGRLKRNPPPEEVEETETLLKLIKVGWGRENPAFRQVFASHFLPEGTPEQISWFTDLQRLSISTENAIRFSNAFWDIDVSDLTTRVAVPTLVLHARDDVLAPFDEGRQLAALIPNARFVSLESKNHILLEDEPAWSRFLAEVHRFLGTSGSHNQMTVATPSPTLNVTTPPFFKQATELPEVEKSVFVAREQELDKMATALATARTGKGQVLFVIGGAGRGKTTLVQEFARRAQAADPDLIAVNGYCNVHTGPGDPYLPFREVLTLLTGDVEARWAGGLITQAYARRLWNAMPLTLPALVEYAPDLIDTFLPGKALQERAATFAPQSAAWYGRLTSMVSGEQRAGLEQMQTITQYATVLKAVAAQRPLLLIIEDLHWADASSGNLLFHLSREVSDSRILIVGTYRPEEVVLNGPLSDSETRERHPLAEIVTELKRRHGDIWLDLGKTAP